MPTLLTKKSLKYQGNRDYGVNLHLLRTFISLIYRNLFYMPFINLDRSRDLNYKTPVLEPSDHMT